MAARRRYLWRYTPDNPWPAERAAETALAAEFLKERCAAEPQFYSDPLVVNTVYGWVDISLTVSAKDQWRVPWRVRNKLLPALAVAMVVDRRDIAEVESAKLPPHRHPNRGARWLNRTK